MGFYPAREILPGLWVGSSADARDTKFLKNRDIQLVVNATKTIPFTSKRIMGFRVPVDDAFEENDAMLEYFSVTCRIIDDNLTAGKSVLVHCYAGIQRSCAIAAAYLICKYDMTARQAIRFIKERKFEAFTPTPTFERALERFAKSRS